MPNETAIDGNRLKPRTWVLIGLSLALFIGANAHLVYVSVASQPDCISHLKVASPDGAGESGYRAARSAC